MHEETAFPAPPAVTGATPPSTATPRSVLGKQIRTGKRVHEDAIRICAYQKWEAAGKPAGDGVQFWLAAEQELSRSRPSARSWWTHMQRWLARPRWGFIRKGSWQHS